MIAAAGGHTDANTGCFRNTVFKSVTAAFKAIGFCSAFTYRFAKT